MDISRDMIESIVRKVLEEQYGGSPNKVVDPSGIISVKVPEYKVSEADRLDTGNAKDVVYTQDIFSLEESRRLGCGIMEMKETTFDWFLNYDEIDYVISGRLDIIIEGRTLSAGPGEIILIPKGSQIKFSVKDEARFMYFTFPADWQSQV